MRKMTKSDEMCFIEMMKDGCSDSSIEEVSKARHLHPCSAEGSRLLQEL